MANVTTAMLIPFARSNQHVQTVVRELERTLHVHIDANERWEIAEAYSMIKKRIRAQEREATE
jgi:hypothetical protein